MALRAEIAHDGIRLLGCSIGGEESWFTLPEMNIGFDTGRAPMDVLGVEHIFLSHGHIDHCAGLAFYFAQREFLDNVPGTLYVHEMLVEPVRELLRAWAAIDGHEPPSNIVGIRAGIDVPVRRDLIVRTFEVNHARRRSDGRTIPAMGFTVIEVRQKLLDEYHGLTGPQLVEIKKAGTEITRRVEMPLVCYCGDTSVGPFLQLECVRKARVLLLECTFIDPDHRDRARAGAHMHLHDVVRVLPRLENERILLTHLTRRTTITDAKSALAAALRDAPDPRVSFFMEHRKRRSRHPDPPESSG